MSEVKVEGDWVIFNRTDKDESEFAIRLSEVKTIGRHGNYVLINGEEMLASYEDAAKAVIHFIINNKKTLCDNKG